MEERLTRAHFLQQATERRAAAAAEAERKRLADAEAQKKKREAEAASKRARGGLEGKQVLARR